MLTASSVSHSLYVVALCSAHVHCAFCAPQSAGYQNGTRGTTAYTHPPLARSDFCTTTPPLLAQVRADDRTRRSERETTSSVPELGVESGDHHLRRESLGAEVRGRRKSWCSNSSHITPHSSTPNKALSSRHTQTAGQSRSICCRSSVHNTQRSRLLQQPHLTSRPAFGQTQTHRSVREERERARQEGGRAHFRVRSGTQRQTLNFV